MIFSRLFHHPRWWLILLAFSLAIPSLRASEPAIRNLDIRGLRIGGTTTLVLDGDNLGKMPRLFLPFAAKQALKPGATDKRAVFEVTLADEVTPGYYHLRVVAEGGVSLPIVIAIDRLPQQAVTAPVKELPVALHRLVAGKRHRRNQVFGQGEAKGDG